MRKSPILVQLEELLSSKILFLDGAMGTMLQQLKLDEAAFRGTRFKSHGKDLKGNSEALIFSQPEALYNVHMSYLEAGADIIETNTFNANAVSQAEYGLESLVPEMNLEAVKIAKRAAGDYSKRTGRPAY